MKKIIVLIVCLVPALAFGQQTYTNEDLTKLQVPGAYTNEDLKRLSPLPVQREAAAEVPEYSPPRPPRAAFQASYDGLREVQALLKAEIAIERDRIEFSESAFAGDTRQTDVRLGYRAKGAVLIKELTKRVKLLDAQMDYVAELARRAGAPVDRR